MLRALVLMASVLLVAAFMMGLCLVLSLRVPFLGALVGMVAFPLIGWYPEFGRTGEDVEVGFAWLIVKSWRAFLAFLLYYSALCYALLLPLGVGVVALGRWARVRRGTAERRGVGDGTVAGTQAEPNGAP